MPTDPMDRDDIKARVARLERELAERQQTEAALRQSEERYRLLCETSTDAIVVIDGDDRILYASPSVSDVFGYEPAELVGQALTLLEPPSLREAHRAALKRYLETGTRTVRWSARRTRALHRDGHEFPVEISFSHMLIDGKPMFGGFIRDITEHERTAAELEESELRFRQLAENIREVFWLTDPSKREMLYASPAYEQVWGRDCQDIYTSLGTWMEAIHPEDRDRVIDASLTKQASGDYDEEYRIVRPDGSIRWIRDRAFPVLDDEGNVYRIAGVAEDVTEVKRANEGLRESERRFSTMLANIELISLMLDRQARIIYCNDYLLRLTGWQREEVQDRDWLKVFVAPDDEETRNVFEALVANEPEAWHHDNEILTKSGGRRLIRWNNSVLRSAEGDVIGTASIGEDITERNLAEQKIRRLNRMYATLSAVNSVIVRARDRQQLLDEICRIAVKHGGFGIAWIGFVDPQTQRIDPVACSGIARRRLERNRVSAHADSPGGSGTAGQALRSGKAAVCNDIRNEPGIGTLRDEALARGYHSVATLPLLSGDAAVGVMVLYSPDVGFFDDDELRLLDEIAGDISFGLQYLAKDERLSYLAYYDSLTGLANATLFHDRLALFLQSAQHNRSMVAVLLVDLDRFTQLNDTLGRHVGDTLLKEVAERFTAALWEPYSIARISADAYAVAVPDLRSGVEAATIIQGKLLACLDAPFMVDGQDVRITARAGIALYPDDGEGAATLFKNAEAALKHAQASGDRYSYYAPEINARVAERIAIESKLRYAIEREQYLLHYQPKIDAKSGRTVGLEALLRWNDPQTGIVPPADFIPVLEESGLIVEVGQWVLEQALANYRTWRDSGLQPPRVAINVSAAQLRRPDFVDVVRHAIERSGVPADALELEITESLIMADIDTSISTLEAIGNMGVQIAIDDFGTGYASLRYLANLPVDTLKIDRSFIVSMVDDADSMSIVSTMISLAHALGLRVVAEGVDSEDQARFLRLLKCDELQGFLFSRPLPVDEVDALLQRS